MVTMQDGKINVYVLRSMSDDERVRHEFHSSSSVLLDREVRVKFYMGQVSLSNIFADSEVLNLSVGGNG